MIILENFIRPKVLVTVFPLINRTISKRFYPKVDKIIMKHPTSFGSQLGDFRPIPKDNEDCKEPKSDYYTSEAKSKAISILEQRKQELRNPSEHTKILIITESERETYKKSK